MSDGRSEDHDRPEGRKTPAASDLLAMWVTGTTSTSQTDSSDEAAEVDPPRSQDDELDTVDTADGAGTAEAEQEEYGESLWPSDESYAGAGASEDTGSERWWPYAADTPSATPTEGASGSPSGGTQPVSSPEQPPASLDARSRDMSTTARWTLDDFERYVRHQQDNELADWIGGRTQTRAADPDDPAGDADTVAGPSAVPPPQAAVAPAASDDVAQGDSDDEDTGVVLDDSDVEWNPPEGEAPSVTAPTEVEDVADEQAAAGTSPWSAWDLDADRTARDEPAPEPDPAQEVLFSSAADQESAVEPSEPLGTTSLTGSAEEPGEAPDDDVWPDAPAPASAPASFEPQQETEQEPEPQQETEPEQASGPEQETARSRWDLQEWYDDYGLRWVSGDGGYTWYSDDGQGWDAEHSLVIPVAPGFDPFPGDPRSPRAGASTSAVEAVAEPAPAPQPDPEPVDRAATERDPRRGPDVERTPEPEEDPDAWASTPADTSSFYAALASDDDSAQTGPEPETRRATSRAAASEERRDRWSTDTTAPQPAPAPTPAAAPTYTPFTEAPTPAPAPRADRNGAAASFPEHVEYKPRGAHRSVLIFFFVVAAVIAVGAIFWAVSRGNQVVWGIAAGITGFALFFWWGLLNWTPTLVSVDGPMLEVSRGSDGERFDLRSPKLDIRVDDDVYSRGWRTTIVRPNGTELVIASSAVDAEEFARIVAHYRDEVSR